MKEVKEKETNEKTNPKKTTTKKKNPNKTSNNKTTVKKDIKKKETENKIVKKESPKSKKINNTKEKSISKKIPEDKNKKREKVELQGPDIDLYELESNIKQDLKKKKKKHKKKIIVLIIMIILLILLIVLFTFLHVLVPTIKIIGDKEIVINYNETYNDLGATAEILNQDLTKRIKITNNVDTSKIGTYEVTYTLKENNYNVTKTRIIKVVDTKKPSITLKGEKEVYVCPDYSGYKEAGYEAIDEYDGNLTDKVILEKKDGQVTYTVKDSSNNEYVITRKIINKDITAPVITLKGNKTLYLGLSEIYTEPGYSVSDNCSVNLTSKVVVNGQVTNGKEGTYRLKYSVYDDSNNKSVVERTVIVSNKTNPNSGYSINGAIYLTFDDGPSSVTTGAILDILKEENVKATFFVTNNGPDYLIKRMYDEGHTVALHTASHNYSYIYKSVDNYFADLNKVSDRVRRITGQTSKIVRFPGGSSNTISRNYNRGIMTSLSNHLFGRGYRYYDWNVDSGDASTSKTKQAVYNRVTSNLSKNRANVVLMHDIKTQTRDALRDIIRYGKANGYTFERIDMDTKMIRQKINN